MSEQNSAQERTEEPTPRRRQQAREKGQIPRSRELTTLALLLSGAGGLVLLGAWMVRELLSILSTGFRIERDMIFDTALLPVHLTGQLLNAAMLLAPFALLMLLVASLSPLALGGWSFSLQSAAPKLEKLDPIRGLGRIFGPRGLMEFAKALAKFLVVISGAAILLFGFSDKLIALSYESLSSAISHAGRLLGWGFLALSSLLILIAAADVPFQIWQHHKQLRMTRQEVKDDLKDTEGRPEVKSRIRQVQREMSRRRMMEAVPGADVVITNPQHYAVALKYEPDKGAPRVVAKGQDFLAKTIRETAGRHDVPIVSAPLLARAIYHSTRIDQPIPVKLYLAVAQVLAYVYQLDAARRGNRIEPEFPRDLQVPSEFLTP